MLISNPGIRWLLTAFAGAVLLAACSGDDEPAATVTAPVPLTTTATSSAPTASPSTTPTGPIEVSGLFTEPRELDADRETTLGSPPPSPFPPIVRNDRQPTVLYDIEAEDTLALGPGQPGVFSPDSRRMAWIAGAFGMDAELRVIDLDSREQEAFGEAHFIDGWADERTVVARLRDNTLILVDVESGTRQPSGYEQPVPASIQGDLRLEREPVAAGEGLTFMARVRDQFGALRLEVEAMDARFAGPGELLVALPWQDATATSNLFIVDLATGEASFVATAHLVTPNTLPLGATDAYIAWTDNYCAVAATGEESEEPGVTRLLDRATGELTDIRPALWIYLAPGNRLGLGEFGPTALLDLDTLEYSTVLPEGAVDVAWSPDYRYASTGSTGGHGGNCPP